MPATLSRPKKKVAAAWRKILMGLPGYDPFAQAGEAWFDVAAAERAIKFCETCIIMTEGDRAGELFRLEPFQKSIVANLFGWKVKDESGRIVRRYREMLLYIARGNGKTVFAAILCLLCLFLDNEPGAQIYGAANTKDQAVLLYRHAKGMIEKAPALKSRCKLYDSSKTVTLLADPLAFYRAIPAEEAPAYGYKTHVALIDELHTQPNRNLVDALTSSMGTRSQPLTIYMTTADYMRESFCNEVYDRACQVRDNSMSPGAGYCDPRFLPIIFEALPDEDWTDEAVWAKANPNLGVSVKIGFLRDECRKAQSTPAYENTFRRMYLNQRTQSDVRAIPADLWEPCGFGAGPVEWRARVLRDMVGQPCVAGLDLGAVNDLTAYVLLFDAMRPKVVLPFFWATEAAVERRRRERVPYDLWARQGFLLVNGGNVADYGKIIREVLDLATKYPLRSAHTLGNQYIGSFMLAVDRLFQAAHVCNQLADSGLKTLEFGQGFASMALPVKRLFEMLGAREIDHGNNPVLAWMAGNASIKTDEAGNMKFDKRKSGDKIDGIVSLTMAAGLSEATPINDVVNPGIIF